MRALRSLIADLLFISVLPAQAQETIGYVGRLPLPLCSTPGPALGAHVLDAGYGWMEIRPAWFVGP